MSIRTVGTASQQVAGAFRATQARKRGIVTPSAEQMETLQRMGFTGFDDDESTKEFVLAYPPSGWIYKRTAQGGPNKVGDLIEFLDQDGRCRIRQIEHLKAFVHLNTIEILPVDN